MADVVPQVVAAPAPRILTDNASDTMRGIALAVLAYLIWTLGDATAKWVLPSVGVAGAMLWRGLFGMATVAAITVGRPGGTGWRRLIPHRWGLVLARSALSSFVSVTWYIAWLSMSLADTYAVGFTAPLIMTVLAIPMLGERIRWRRALSTVIGFGGVLIMLRPGGDLWTPVVVLLLAGTGVMALTRIMTRQLASTETPECQAFWLLVCHTATGFLLLPSFPGSAPITAAGWVALAFLGLSSGLAHCVFARSYALAPVSALAPYEYTMLPWGVVAGFAIFGELPSWNTLIGAVVVAGSGTYNLYRERVRRAEEQAASGTG
ncbi:MAG TPA: DMT family transporter [Acetobacteraceae bacterium]|nr:DMT family transporter [Acetobacteraceae bacterium]